MKKTIRKTTAGPVHPAKAARAKEGFFEGLLEKNPEAMRALVVAAILVLIIAAAAFVPGKGGRANESLEQVETLAPSPTPGARFAATPEFEARVFLVKKYTPSICFGTPKNPSETDLAEFLSKRPGGEVDAVKMLFGAASDFQAFERLTQLDQVVLQRTSYSSFLYQIDDGQCCSVMRRTGSFDSRGMQDTPAGVQVQNIPC